MRKKIKIIFSAQDPGGFNAILPVIKKLKKKKNFLLKIILANQSRDIAKKHKISYQDGNRLTNKKLVRLLEKESPDLIFTATSDGYSVEKRITKIAKAQKIKTLAIIDFWINYKPRFSDPGSENLSYLPDYILAIDKTMKKEMVNQGFDSKKIVVTGSPFFDTFSKPTGYKKKKNLITFFSQPFSELYKRKDKTYLGFDEIQVFQNIIEILEKINQREEIVIKLHPRCRKFNKFDRIIKKSKLKISIEKNLSAEDLIKKSKLVIGMNSIVLFQAAMMGKAVLSYQPNLKGPDPLMSNRLKLSVAVYKRDNLYPALKQLLSGRLLRENLKLIKKYTRNNSTQRVMDFIKSIVRK